MILLSVSLIEYNSCARRPQARQHSHLRPHLPGPDDIKSRFGGTDNSRKGLVFDFSPLFWAGSASALCFQWQHFADGSGSITIFLVPKTHRPARRSMDNCDELAGNHRAGGPERQPDQKGCFMDLMNRACFGLIASLAVTTGIVAPALAQQRRRKPNILVDCDLHHR
jgi:hypothetical protein